ncbi:MAG: DNA-directed RNA polymerase subunit beta [Candidatus Wildermuthbacteria bacterium RIFCSPLOWO2_01_FULL_47_18]|uniref:DNA-directed RNA polymerase subunit beta n=1 Tax=Candidatus Wildermuthbacteria bacterium RIFCSPLOWO2_01_FULL_47_18 TaxID=1802460 RepID=A0A1G2RIF3_9BACT|nr:MAG: DNA-directed RNA polymerase subunit beta [Candidatus Wildermuthbacteria bacterium RIFCSPLOWO2_01_FULL_47_18]OHB17748.1 MAG: DNA-directed RNA polymerase subunit beta [Parcubacteria group bacterium RIFCSPHIGHO2_01_FULL_45_26]
MFKTKKKYFSRFKEPLLPLSNLVEVQMNSFENLLSHGLKEIFKEFSPINDYSGKKFSLEFIDFALDKPVNDEYYAKENKLTYDAPLKARVRLKNKLNKEEKDQDIFLLDFPLMTTHGTFIINGVERVIVPQLARSFGVMFVANYLKGRRYMGAKIIPSRGAWVEIEIEQDDCIYVRIDKKRKFPASALLRAFSKNSDHEIVNAFGQTAIDSDYIKNTFAKDQAKTREESLVEVYSKIREGDLASPETAEAFISGLFGEEKYDLSTVGRFRFNERFGMSTEQGELKKKILDFKDLLTTIKHIITLQVDVNSTEDDIDHLGSRRVRSVGELLQQKLRQGMAQMKRNVQDRMSTADPESVLPVQFVTPRPLAARVKEFFTTNQLSQFMAQENVLAEMEHLRRMSALGPGGLTRERAGYEVRDVHTSHYGRVCPIETPEGPNIGLILTLASYAKVNELGVIEAPYAQVKKGRITGEIVYMNAFDEEKYPIAHGATPYDADGMIINEVVEVRVSGNPTVVSRDEVAFIDVAPHQAYSLATAMIPFLEHDEANRALMGSNMQKQATPCVVPEAPLVATGVEVSTARSSGRLVLAESAGEVSAVDARKVVVRDSAGDLKTYSLINFSRSNQFTIFHQRPVVDLGQSVKKGELLADTSTSVGGEVALGQNALVAFLSWGGFNYEDAIVVSERLVKNAKFTSIHIEEFVCDVRDTKLGPEVTTHDIPNVSETKLRNLDEEGVIRIGAEVGPNDILIGKITPKGETELTPEERLLRSIFGEKARDVKDSSLRMEHGKRGRIIGVKIFSRDKGDKLESGIIKRVYVEVAQLRNISVGDKLSGRHGNKGVVSRVLPEEDMPYLEDGTPVDIVLTPLGVPSRMNLGQILEMHLGLAAHTLGYQAIAPTFAGPTEEEIKKELVLAGVPESGQVKLFDGQTGEAFEQDVAIGYMYFLKLHHMVEDKIHMRSIGPYSLITQQPLGGRAQGGGQRFGEMEVWALEGYGASQTLREMLTIKSDDIVGRSAAFDSIVRGEDIGQINLPASFNVLLNELRGLALDIELKKLPNNQL